MTNDDRLHDEHTRPAGAHPVTGDPAAPHRDDQQFRSDEEWWASLSPEDRYLAIETVRLDEGTDGLSVPFERPTGARAEFVRRQPEYLERYASADHIARVDDPGFGPENRPHVHEDTHPIDPRRDADGRDRR